jgi:hypothetical protein
MTQVFNMRQHLLTSGEFENVHLDSKKFRDVTDQAASYARLPMQTTGKKGQESINFFSALAITTQFKFNGDKAYRPLLQALRGTEAGPAQEAFKNTPAYKDSTDAEKARLLEQLSKIIKGM